MRFINLILAILLAGCSTTGNFKVPKRANLYIYKRPVPVVINVDESISTDEVIVGTVTSNHFSGQHRVVLQVGVSHIKLKKMEK